MLSIAIFVVGCCFDMWTMIVYHMIKEKRQEVRLGGILNNSNSNRQIEVTIEMVYQAIMKLKE